MLNHSIYQYIYIEILAQATYLTVDPYMRGRSVEVMKIGDQFPGGQVARLVIKSVKPLSF